MLPADPSLATAQTVIEYPSWSQSVRASRGNGGGRARSRLDWRVRRQPALRPDARARAGETASLLAPEDGVGVLVEVVEVVEVVEQILNAWTGKHKGHTGANLADRTALGCLTTSRVSYLRHTR